MKKGRHIILIQNPKHPSVSTLIASPVVWIKKCNSDVYLPLGAAAFSVLKPFELLCSHKGKTQNSN